MTTIRTTCPKCGEVDMGPESIVLCVHGEGEGTYSFVCPVCSEDVEKQADRKIVSLLVSAGVSVAGGLSAAPVPADDHPGLAPLTMDDLIQFHFLLEDEGYLDQLLAEGR